MPHSGEEGHGDKAVCSSAGKSELVKSLDFHANDCRFYPMGSSVILEYFKKESDIDMHFRKIMWGIVWNIDQRS